MRSYVVIVVSILISVLFTQVGAAEVDWDPKKGCLQSYDHDALRPENSGVWHEQMASNQERDARRPIDSLNWHSVGPWSIDINHRQGGAFSHIAIAWIDNYFAHYQSSQTDGAGIFSGEQCINLEGATIHVAIDRADLIVLDEDGTRVNNSGARLLFWFQTALEPAGGGLRGVGPKYNFRYIGEDINLPSVQPGKTTITLSADVSKWQCMGFNEQMANHTSAKNWTGYDCPAPDQQKFSELIRSVNMNFGFMLFLPGLPKCSARYSTQTIRYTDFDCWFGRAVRLDARRPEPGIKDRYPSGYIRFGALNIRRH